MRSRISVTVALATLFTATPALAQMNESTPSQRAAIANEQMRQQNRFDGYAKSMNGAGATAALVAQYRADTAAYRANALDIAAQVKGATLPAEVGPQIRAALEADMELWRNTFHVHGKEWKSWRDQWLVDASKLSAVQWAAQRANWYGARDAWLDKVAASKK